MKELSAYEAKKSNDRAPRKTAKVEFRYTVDGELYTFSELSAKIRSINPSITDSKIRGRLDRGHRTLDKLTVSQQAHHRPHDLRGRK